ncbi:hypothetical protein ASD65_10695 [Microbacterium sp. Root61]|uniref:PaaX family transcriptional regulator C-terminal domain-containing protein n=1 Tax=Microbacterium sp. Root61 TaxID=1736570 RepID=UPI0007011445|nr:PaaX family transcriptional regulator C-terminal domain-containing protein [Microbacterium sp. Root61]KRA24840.1 hypothetical protein ASD65_10695 [Microbacterium sp. Root61]
MSEVVIAPKTVVAACFSAEGVAELEMVYGVAAAVGLADQPVRLAIRRMEAHGVLDQVGRGRKGRLVLTESGKTRERLDGGHLAFVSSQDAGMPTWQGVWCLYAFSVPERLRAERDSLRTALVRLGAASLANGVYVSPFDLRDDLAAEVAPATIGRYLITAEAARLDGPGLGDPKQVVETLWPAADIEAAYEGLERALSDADGLSEEASVPTRLACALRLAAAFTFALEHDPLIPFELRDPDWSPPIIRHRFREMWERLRHDLPEVRLFRAHDPSATYPTLPADGTRS